CSDGLILYTRCQHLQPTGKIRGSNTAQAMATEQRQRRDDCRDRVPPRAGRARCGPGQVFEPADRTMLMIRAVRRWIGPIRKPPPLSRRMVLFFRIMFIYLVTSTAYYIMRGNVNGLIPQLVPYSVDTIVALAYAGRSGFRQVLGLPPRRPSRAGEES